MAFQKEPKDKSLELKIFRSQVREKHSKGKKFQCLAVQGKKLFI